MKKHLFYISLVFAASCLVSCGSTETVDSDMVKQSEIYQSYSLTHDASKGTLTASASFKLGGSTGTTLHLVKPGRVTVNRKDMFYKKRMFGGTAYNLEEQSAFSPEHTFEFTDSDGKTYRNTARLNLIEAAEYPKKANTRNDIVITWTGGAVRNNEKITLNIRGEDGSSYSKTTDIVGTDRFVVSLKDNTAFKSGNAEIGLERTSTRALSSATYRGGSITTTYKSKKVGTYIENPFYAEPES